MVSPIPAPLPVPFIVFMVSIPVVFAESDDPVLLPELLQLADASAINAINNARLMVLVFCD
jgi:hypothetical protein